MKKIGILIFISALIIGVVIANFTSFGGPALKSPVSFVFGSKIHGSGNVVTESRNTGEFTGIAVGGILNVDIKKADKLSVVVEADDNVLPVIKTVVKGGTLKIWSDKSFKSKSRVTVRITAPNIESIDSSGVARVKFTGISNDDLQVESSGASRVELEGTVQTLEIDISGASKIRADKLAANEAEVDGSGASSVTVDVKSQLIADVSGASKVRYTGEPTELKKSVSGAGSVSKIK